MERFTISQIDTDLCSTLLALLLQQRRLCSKLCRKLFFIQCEAERLRNSLHAKSMERCVHLIAKRPRVQFAALTVPNMARRNAGVRDRTAYAYE